MSLHDAKSILESVAVAIMHKNEGRPSTPSHSIQLLSAESQFRADVDSLVRSFLAAHLLPDMTNISPLVSEVFEDRISEAFGHAVDLLHSSEKPKEQRTEQEWLEWLLVEWWAVEGVHLWRRHHQGVAGLGLS